MGGVPHGCLTSCHHGYLRCAGAVDRKQLLSGGPGNEGHQVHDIISEDWLTWLGTLALLLWLLYVMLL